MNRQIKACLLGALLVGGCREQENQMNPVDMAVGNMPVDMSGQMMTAMTIRDLNGGKVQTGAMVKVTGVVISPFTWVDTNQAGTNCEYHLFVVQPDANPTLNDGIRVYFSKRESDPDMGLNSARCRDLGKDYEIVKAKSGALVEVAGRFQSNSGYRELFVTGGNGVTDKGMPTEMPKPVVVEPKQFTNLAMFQAGQSAYVQFKDVTTDGAEMAFPFRFFLYAGMDKTVRARVATNYLQTQMAGYMPPADGTEYASVTGIAATLFGGGLWPRSANDLVAK